MSSRPIQRFGGSQLASWNWYTSQPGSHILTHPPAPCFNTETYTHTLLFPIHTHHLLLARKNRGFAASTYNAIGGKLDNESPLQSILRETREEIHIPLDVHQVHFTGRIRISVDRGEKVCIALYTAKFDDELKRRVRASEEVEPHWYDVGKDTRGVWWERLPQPMRPEHRVYLPVLWYHYVQGDVGVLVDVQVDFDAEPKKEHLEDGERPENHRTLRRWSLDVLPLSAAADLAAG